MNTSLRLVDFGRESVDAAIRFGRGAWPDLHSRALTPRTLAAVASPALVGRNALSDEHVKTWPIIEVSTVPREWDEWCSRAGIDRQAIPRAMVVDTVQLALQAAEAGLGIALARPLLVADALRQGTLCAPFQTVATSESTYFFSALPGALMTNPVKAFASWLFEEAEQTQKSSGQTIR